MFELVPALEVSGAKSTYIVLNSAHSPQWWWWWWWKTV